MFNNQTVLPAIRKMKYFDKLMESDYEHIVLLDSHIGNVKNIVLNAKKNRKKMYIHMDLIQGLKNDEYATDYICQEIKPHGLISTRANVIIRAKKKGLIAIQRLFLLDSSALTKSYELLDKTKPDFIEVLPGVMPHIIKEIYEETKIPIIAGGFIRKEQEVDEAIQAGAVAVTTSRKELWNKNS
ncbi:glycerol-3-phosphate responsive antiterminator [Longirhabdus pacifica]|uniref:glycerol-3-phosphate responsive antiterminator n=1 Tax=Longirhabdus pacifica TaxID=2305227 RepID=UPI0010089D63|nr:glycerol-3-phosphate responsive antiterminator [Longirhabdus pacifica]